TLDGVHGVEREVVEDEEVDGDRAPELELVAVVEPCDLERLEELLGALEVDRVAAPASGVAEGLREVSLPDADRADDRDVRARLEESQRDELVQELAVVAHLRRRVPRLEGRRRVEPRSLRA